MHTAMELVLSEKESSESMALVLSLHSPGTKIFTSTISSVELVLSEKESSESTALVLTPHSPGTKIFTAIISGTRTFRKGKFRKYDPRSIPVLVHVLSENMGVLGPEKVSHIFRF